MDQSAFMVQERKPDDKELQHALGKSYAVWKDIEGYVLQQSQSARVSWHYSKVGWNCRISDAKRVIIYLMPCEGYFKASLVLGKNAVAAALASSIPEEFKTAITSAKTYAEGTGFRLPVKTGKALPGIKILIDLKLG